MRDSQLTHPKNAQPKDHHPDSHAQILLENMSSLRLFSETPIVVIDDHRVSPVPSPKDEK